ncbi:MAG: energy transducer TonB [Rhodospirillaceae bacterium]|nr:energy transducer TonB [Rhodospirillaceae bacterium]
MQTGSKLFLIAAALSALVHVGLLAFLITPPTPPPRIEFAQVVLLNFPAPREDNPSEDKSIARENPEPNIKIERPALPPLVRPPMHWQSESELEPKPEPEVEASKPPMAHSAPVMAIARLQLPALTRPPLYWRPAPIDPIVKDTIKPIARNPTEATTVSPKAAKPPVPRPRLKPEKPDMPLRIKPSKIMPVESDKKIATAATSSKTAPSLPIEMTGDRTNKTSIARAAPSRQRQSPTAIAVRTTEAAQQAIARYAAKLFEAINGQKKYPRLSRRRGETGRVALRVTIARDGQLVAVSSSTKKPRRLVRASLETVRRAAPFPRLHDGVTDDTVFNLVIVYELD